MSIPKKRTSVLKKKIRKNIWKKKMYRILLNTFSLAKSLSTRISKSYFI